MGAAFQERTRAVLVADCVDYTRLMEAAEFDTHSRFRSLRVSIIDPTIVSNRGELVKNTGDGFVAVFETASDAIACAITLQSEIEPREQLEPPERRIRFRVGLHWQSVIHDLNDVYGRGVNTAARLEQVAPPGGIVVSADFHDMLGAKQELPFVDLGPLELRHMTKPVSAYLLAQPEDTAAARTIMGSAPGSAKLPAIAILPFQNSPASPEQNYYAEGFIDDIVASLCKLKDILVVSRGSTVAFRQSNIEPAIVGQKLGVQYVLYGRFRRSEKRIRISVELVDIDTTAVLWAEHFDADISDVFDVQDEIVVRTAAQIATHIRNTEVRRALRKRPADLNAYDYFLQGIDLLPELEFSRFMRAGDFFQKSCDQDRSYAAPLAYLALWHHFNIAEGWSPNPAAEAEEIIRLTGSAIDREPGNELALALRGQALAMYYKDYDNALEFVDRAVLLSPNSSWAWALSSGPYGFVGETESAIQRAQKAIRLSPIDQHQFFFLNMLGQNYYLNGDYESAVRWERCALAHNRRFGNAARVLAASLVALQCDNEAHEVATLHNATLPGFRIAEYGPRCPFMGEAGNLYVDRLRKAGINP